MHQTMISLYMILHKINITYDQPSWLLSYTLCKNMEERKTDS